MPVYQNKNTGYWFFKVSIGNKQYIRRGQWSKGTAKQAELMFMQEMHSQPKHRNITFLKLFNEFIEWKKISAKPTYIYETKLLVDKTIMPTFGSKHIDEITSKEIIQWQTKMSKNGLSTSYLSRIFAMMKMIMAFAFNHFGLEYDPFKDVRNIPKGKTKKRIDFFTPSEADAFLAAITDYEDKVLFFTFIYTGMRAGEIQALKIGDVDLERGKIGVHFSFIDKPVKVEHVKEDQLQDPKTETSNRIITMTDEHWAMMREFIPYLEKKYGADASSFLFGVSSPISRTTMTRRKNIYCKKANVKTIRLHDFRHTWTSLAVSRFGVTDIMAISRHLGHSNSYQTLATYSHILPNSEENMMRNWKK